MQAFFWEREDAFVWDYRFYTIERTVFANAASAPGRGADLYWKKYLFWIWTLSDYVKCFMDIANIFRSSYNRENDLKIVLISVQFLKKRNCIN